MDYTLKTCLYFIYRGKCIRNKYVLLFLFKKINIERQQHFQKKKKNEISSNTDNCIVP